MLAVSLWACSAKPESANDTPETPPADAAINSEDAAAAENQELLPDLLLPASTGWTREEALAQMDDDVTRLSAAVRLIRFAEQQPLCLPEETSPALLKRLRVLTRPDGGWVLGFALKDPQAVSSPVFIDAEGGVTLPLDGVEEEIAIFRAGEAGGYFPNLLLLPQRVFVVADEVALALGVKSPDSVRFAVRLKNGQPYVALLWQDAEHRKAVEVAQYRYDALEFCFMGPQADELPDPPGGTFELDLEASAALIPVGGILPDPPETPELPRPQPVEYDGVGPSPY